ncbi:MAG: helicase-related protein [Methylococcales bacterium]
MSSLSQRYTPLMSGNKKEPPTGLDGFVYDMIGLVHRHLPYQEKLRSQAEKILAASLQHQSLSEEDLTLALQKSRFYIKRGENEDELNSALSYIIEASARTMGKRPYEVQLLGVLALQHNYIIEMKPGEGKTLTASLAAVLKGWIGKPCHVITSNDYLAARDAELSVSLLQRCGLSVGSILPDLSDQQRREQYRCDVVFATSKELHADFLRDQMRLNGELNHRQLLIRKVNRVTGKEQPVMCGLYSVIIDEADSVLGDDATTPLIISTQGENHLLKEATLATKAIADKLRIDEHYQVNYRFKVAKLTPAGEQIVEDLSEELPSIWRIPMRRDDLLQKTLSAREFFIRDRHYTLIDNKVEIVDEKTGRLMPGRSWGYGLHQAIEAKEGVELSDPAETQAKLSFQRFFRLYDNLSGMSGTLQGLEKEFWRIYNIPFMRIPPRLPTQLKVLEDLLYKTEAEKWQAVIQKIREYSNSSRPVLVGTRSIIESQTLGKMLEEQGMKCNVLNALLHAEEAEIIAQAAQRYRITIATNMAGRGTDIILDKDVIASGGLHVIACERYISRRIAWQLYGRAGRQGQPGSAQAIISLEDEMLDSYCSQAFIKFLRLISDFRLGKLFALMIYARIQKKSERYTSALRNSMLQRDLQLSEQLSFASSDVH